LVHFEEVVKEETSDRNSLWRIHEIARTIGSRRDAEKLSVGSNGGLLVFDPWKVPFKNSGFRSNRGMEIRGSFKSQKPEKLE
jgi:hypothetical protein